MTNYRKLASQAESEIEALRADGVVLKDSDIVSINALCWEIETPSRRVSLAKGKPIKCGNVWLWPLTIHASDWFSNVGSELPCSEIALAFAMAHREKELSTVEEPEILAWFKTIHATIDELQEAMACIINETMTDDLPVNRENGITIAQLAQLMVDKHSGSFDMWERQCSIGYIFDFLDTCSKQDEAEKKKTHRDKRTLVLARYTQKLLRDKQNGR